MMESRATLATVAVIHSYVDRIYSLINGFLSEWEHVGQKCLRRFPQLGNASRARRQKFEESRERLSTSPQDLSVLTPKDFISPRDRIAIRQRTICHDR